MSGILKSWHTVPAIAVLVGLMGLPERTIMSQEHDERSTSIAVRQPPNERERSELPTERDILRQQVEVFRIALHGLLEADKRDAAEMLERAIRAREVTLEGRRDDEAHMIRQRAPSREQLARILTMSAGLWREFDNEDKAAAVGRVAEAFARPGDRDVRRERAEEGARDRGDRPNEREMARRHLEVMRVALPALRESERRDAVELLERAIRAHEVMLEGRRDDEAHQIRERMPNRGQLAEILVMSSRLWRRFNNHDKAEIVGQLARELAEGRDRERERPVRERSEAAERQRDRTIERRSDIGAGAEEVQRLKNAVRELSGQMTDLQREVAEMRQLLRELVEQRREDR